MKLQLEKLRDEIKEHNANSKTQAEKYESIKCWSYAYLSRWIVLEQGLKSLYNLHNRDRIRRSALEWLDYLDGKLPTVPGKIKDFSVKTKHIPPYTLVKELLGTTNNIKTAMNPNGKYRLKRNKIAHKAVEFGSEKNYIVYRKTIDGAITQLLTKLSQKIKL